MSGGSGGAGGPGLAPGGRPRIAFHAPMKPPEHPNPSGDRRIARLTLAALERAGYAPFVASSLRTLEMAGDAGAQADLARAAEAEVARLVAALRAAPPALWFTYHSYWKAPDLVGPAVSAALGLPYVISEPILSVRRREGGWVGFAEAAERSLAAADLLLWSTARDLPSLRANLPGARLEELAPFVDLGPAPGPRPEGAGPLRLLAVAMMRPGDKLASYAALAAALAHPEAPDLRLEVIGDGPERAATEALLAPLGPRVRFRGAEADPARLRAAMEAADLLVWPGVNEGFGMVYLEAQAAGLPALAEDRPGPRHVLPPPPAGLVLPPPGDAGAMARILAALAADRGRLASLRVAARAHAEARHGLDAAAARLKALLDPLIAAPGGDENAGSGASSPRPGGLAGGEASPVGGAAPAALPPAAPPPAVPPPVAPPPVAPPSGVRSPVVPTPAERSRFAPPPVVSSPGVVARPAPSSLPSRNAPMQIALLRHFPTDWNAEGRLQGRSDVPLSAEGRAELALRRLPEEWRGRPILCSPLSRARETAETLAEGAPIRFDDRLMEMDMGAWEGRMGAELSADPDCAWGPVEGWGMAFRAPGGEGPADMMARLAPLFAELTEPTLLVMHRGVMRAALAMATGWRYEGPETFRIKKFALHPMVLEGGRPAAIGAPVKLVMR